MAKLYAPWMLQIDLPSMLRHRMAITVIILGNIDLHATRSNDTAQRWKFSSLSRFRQTGKQIYTHTKWYCRPDCQPNGFIVEVCMISRLSFSESHLQVVLFCIFSSSFVGVYASKVRSIEKIKSKKTQLFAKFHWLRWSGRVNSWFLHCGKHHISIWSRAKMLKITNIRIRSNVVVSYSFARAFVDGTFNK